MNGPTPRLVTWSWRPAFERDVNDELILVRISRGAPGWLSHALVRNLPRVKALEPGVMLPECESWEQFRGLFLDQLEEFGVDLISRQLRAAAHGSDLPLALLCHCTCRANCHRGLFAWWWEQQTGQEIPEWDPQLHRPEPEPENVQEVLC